MSEQIAVAVETARMRPQINTDLPGCDARRQRRGLLVHSKFLDEGSVLAVMGFTVEVFNHNLTHALRNLLADIEDDSYVVIDGTRAARTG